MDPQRRVEACGGEDAEALHHPEVFRRHQLHAQSPHQHHTESDPGADAVGTAGPVLRPGGGDHTQGQQGEQHHRSGDSQMHDILKGPGVSALREREHPVAHGADPLHHSKEGDAPAQQPGLPALDAQADRRDTNHLTDIVEGAELVPEGQGRGVGGAQVADGLGRPAVARIGQRGKDHRRRVGQQADDAQQAQLLQQRLSHAFPRSPASGSGSTIRSKSMSRPPIRKKAGKVQSFRKPYRS